MLLTVLFNAGIFIICTVGFLGNILSLRGVLVTFDEKGALPVVLVLMLTADMLLLVLSVTISVIQLVRLDIQHVAILTALVHLHMHIALVAAAVVAVNRCMALQKSITCNHNPIMSSLSKISIVMFIVIISIVITPWSSHVSVGLACDTGVQRTMPETASFLANLSVVAFTFCAVATFTLRIVKMETRITAQNSILRTHVPARHQVRHLIDNSKALRWVIALDTLSNFSLCVIAFAHANNTCLPRLFSQWWYSLLRVSLTSVRPIQMFVISGSLWKAVSNVCFRPALYRIGTVFLGGRFSERDPPPDPRSPTFNIVPAESHDVNPPDVNTSIPKSLHCPYPPDVNRPIPTDFHCQYPPDANTAMPVEPHCLYPPDVNTTIFGNRHSLHPPDPQHSYSQAIDPHVPSDSPNSYVQSIDARVPLDFHHLNPPIADVSVPSVVKFQGRRIVTHPVSSRIPAPCPLKDNDNLPTNSVYSSNEGKPSENSFIRSSLYNPRSIVYRNHIPSICHSFDETPVVKLKCPKLEGIEAKGLYDSSSMHQLFQAKTVNRNCVSPLGNNEKGPSKIEHESHMPTGKTKQDRMPPTSRIEQDQKSLISQTKQDQKHSTGKAKQDQKAPIYQQTKQDQMPSCTHVLSMIKRSESRESIDSSDSSESFISIEKTPNPFSSQTSMCNLVKGSVSSFSLCSLNDVFNSDDEDGHVEFEHHLNVSVPNIIITDEDDISTLVLSDVNTTYHNMLI